ncbi:hypothetical protein LCGC14_1369930 [marine sediment metagenome]|uniref:Uncharacterized protein n=1 Tax=marine sediment metagenome TaxID=412755 RepID=A0A0F9K5S4_9ZZZZ
MSNETRLLTATNQSTLIAAAYEAGRMMRKAGHSQSAVYPTRWNARLRVAFGDGFALSSAPASWAR